MAIRIEVYIQPRASVTELAGLHDGRIKIRIAAPPMDNAANAALVEFIARRLGITKGNVRIVSGTSSRRKILEVDGVSAGEVTMALAPGG